MVNGIQFKAMKRYLIILSIIVVATAAVFGGYEGASLAASRSEGQISQGVDL